MMGLGFGMGLLGWLWMLLFWGGLLLLAVWLVSLIFPTSQKSTEAESSSSASAQEILDVRYARGELTEEQYQQMRQTIQTSC